MIKGKLISLISSGLCSDTKLLSTPFRLLLPLVMRIRPKSDLYVFYINELVTHGKYKKALRELEGLAIQKKLEGERLNWCSSKVFSAINDKTFKLEVLLVMLPHVYSLDVFTYFTRWFENHAISREFLTYTKSAKRLLEKGILNKEQVARALSKIEPIDIIIGSSSKTTGRPTWYVDPVITAANSEVERASVDSPKIRKNKKSNSSSAFFDVANDKIITFPEPRQNILVFVESGADILFLLENDDFYNCNYTVYAFNSMASEINAPNVRVKSLRDLIPDNTETSHDIYQKTNQFAEILKHALLTVSDVAGLCSEKALEIILRTLDDKLATHMHLGKCFEKALEMEASADRILIVLSQGNQMLPMIPAFEAIAGYGTLFLTSSTMSAQAIEKKYRKLIAESEYSRQNYDASSECSVDVALELENVIPDVIERAEITATNYPKDAHLIASIFNSPVYRTATIELANYLFKGGQKVALCENVPLPWDFFSQYKLSKEMGGEPYIISHGNLINLVSTSPRLKASFADLANAAIGKALHYSKSIIKGNEAVYYSLAHSFIQGQLANSLLQYHYFNAFFQMTNCAAVYAVSSRVAQLGLLVIAAEEQGIATIDVQALNVHAHPKYRAPITSFATAIDDVAADILTNYFHYPADKIKVLGSPNYDQLVRKVNQVDRDQVRAKLGLANISKNAILFASQLQPIERCESIIKQLITVSLETGCNLIIKPHPREEDNRIWLYKELIQEFGDTSTMRIAQGCDAYEVIALTNVTVTMFSNVAREAFLCGHKVVVANYFGTTHPIEFDKEGLAASANSENDLVELVKGYLLDPSEDHSNEYIKRNNHLTLSNASQKIVELANKVNAGAKKKDQSQYINELVLNHQHQLENVLYFSLQNGHVRMYQLALAHFSNSEILDSNAVFFAIIKAKQLSETGLFFETISRLMVPMEVFIKQRKKLVTEIIDSSELFELTDFIIAQLKSASHGETGIQTKSLFKRLRKSHIKPLLVYALCIVDYLKANGHYDNCEMLLNTLIECDPANADEIYRKEFINTGVLSLGKPSLETDNITLLVLGKPDCISLHDYIHNLQRKGRLITVITETPDLFKDYIGIKIVDTQKYALQAGEEVGEALGTVSNQVRNLFIETLSESLQGTLASEFVIRQKAAIMNWLRVTLIRVTRKPLQIRLALQEHLDSNLNVLCSSVNDLQTMSGFNFAEKVAGSTHFICFSDNTAIKSSCLSFAQENFVEQREFDVFDKRFVSFDQEKFSKGLNEFLSQERQPILEAKKEAKILFVSSWQLKTVGPTVAPIAQTLLRSTKVDIININVGSFNSDIERMVLTEVDDWRKDNLSITSLPDHYTAILPKELAQMLCDRLVVQFCSQLPMAGHDIDLKRQMVRVVSPLCKKLLWTYYWFEQDLMDYLSCATKTLVAVCPGRDMVAMIAQDTARHVGITSVDIQNAYMSGGYTYIAPHGDYVTAIDTWSKNLFENHFNLLSEQVKVLGTPRFDSILALSKASADDYGDLPFPLKGDALVVFATQPVDVEKTLQVIELLAKTDADDMKLDILIKLHPRDTDEYLTFIRRFTASLSSPHNLLVDREIDIHHLIMKSQIVVTMFSNVGIEAAIAGKNLLVSNIGREQMPLPLDEMNIGLNAHTEREFLEGMRALLLNEDTRKSVLATREEYFKLNPQFLRGDSVSTISEFLLEKCSPPAVQGER